MPVDLVLSNAKLFFEGNLVEGGIAVDEGKIVKIAKDTNLPQASNKINLSGQIILPGLIDSHVHLRDQELAYKETFFSGTAAAAAGGVTSVIDMPNNSPVTMDSFLLKKRMEISQNQALVNIAFIAAFPKNPREIEAIVKQGAVGFKVYMSDAKGGIDVNDDGSMLLAFQEAAKNQVPVAVHAEDKKMIETRKREMEEANSFDISSFLYVHNVESEISAIHRVIPIVNRSGAHIHFCHISSASGLNAILMAKKTGSSVTFEVTPHHLFLSSDQYLRHGNFALTVPPLRSQDNVSALKNALNCGLIDIVATDHAPHTVEEKEVKSVWNAKPGIPGLETFLPLFLNEINEGRFSFEELVRVSVQQPAKLFNLSKRGLLNVGNWADLVVVDMRRIFEIDSSVFFSKANYSPFDGMQMKGKPVKTFVNGNLIMDDGEIVGQPGVGSLIS